MSDDDYKKYLEKYLDEKFDHVNDNMKNNFKTVDTQFIGVNHRLDEIEKKVSEFAGHSTNCPQIEKINKIGKDLADYKESQADLNWVQKHPRIAATYFVGFVVFVSFGFLSANKLIPSKGENINKVLIEANFKELKKNDSILEKKVEKRNAYYDDLFSEFINITSVKKPQK